MEISNFTNGILISLAAGIFLGTFAWPMKKIKQWRWENTWLMYSVWALIILPWLLAFFTVPNFLTIYGNVSPIVLLTVFLFGAGWGIASIGFGIGLNTLGLALGTAIVLGLNNALGAILPIIIYTPEELFTPTGVAIILGVSIMLLGIVISALAGSFKDKALRKKDDLLSKNNKFTKGLIICLIAGVFGAMFNFALVAGKPLEVLAIQNGASALNAANPTWCISLLGGFLVTLGYCIYKFRKKQTVNLFTKSGLSKNWGYTAIMGLMWFGGVALYGIAVMNLGKLGASIGWPVIQSMAVLSGNAVGIVSGEWKGTGKKPLVTMLLGLMFLVVGIFVISWAGTL